MTPGISRCVRRFAAEGPRRPEDRKGASFPACRNAVDQRKPHWSLARSLVTGGPRSFGKIDTGSLFGEIILEAACESRNQQEGVRVNGRGEMERAADVSEVIDDWCRKKERSTRGSPRNGALLGGLRASVDTPAHRVLLRLPHPSWHDVVTEPLVFAEPNETGQHRAGTERPMNGKGSCMLACPA